MSEERRLKVTFRRVQTERAGETRVLAVFCPRRTEAVDLRQCQECAHCEGLCVDPTDRDTFVRCTWAAEALPAAQPTRSPSANGVAGAREASLASVMSAPARCVGPELPLLELVQILVEEGIGGAPVVDTTGRPIGIVSKTDVLRQCSAEATPLDRHDPGGVEVAVDLTWTGRSGLTVRDVMTHVVFTLQAEASLSRAAALMAYEGVHRIVVVAADGSALGVVSSLDILRWMARQDGYVVPAPARRSTPRPEPAP